MTDTKTQLAEQQLLEAIKLVFGNHFIPDDPETLLQDISAVLVARKMAGDYGSNPLCKLNVALNAVHANNNRTKK